MTSENQGSNPYDAVISDLRAKRDQIDQTIALLTGLRGGSAPMPLAVNADPGIVETAGMFLGMSISDGAKKLLAMRKQTLGNVEIARELQAGGMAMNSKDPINTVGAVLTRRFNEVGDIVKVGRGIWGLKEWYPNRTFKPSTKASSASPVEGAQPEASIAGESVAPNLKVKPFDNPFADLKL